jgi:hypothetical protein
MVLQNNILKYSETKFEQGLGHMQVKKMLKNVAVSRIEQTLKTWGKHW